MAREERTSGWRVTRLTPGAFGGAVRRRVRAELPQHVTETLGFEASRADHGFALDLQRTTVQFNLLTFVAWKGYYFWENR